MGAQSTQGRMAVAPSPSARRAVHDVVHLLELVGVLELVEVQHLAPRCGGGAILTPGYNPCVFYISWVILPTTQTWG
jgi:hypothetical protein